MQAFSLKQQLYKKFRIEGMSAYRAAINAGYSHNTAIAAYRNIEKRINFADLLVKAGLDNDTIMKVLAEGLLATKVISAMVIVKPNADGTPNPSVKEIPADSKSTDFIDVPDYHIRHKYLETLLKLKGELKEMIETKLERFIIIREIIRDADKSPQGGFSRPVSIQRE